MYSMLRSFSEKIEGKKRSVRWDLSKQTAKSEAHSGETITTVHDGHCE